MVYPRNARRSSGRWLTAVAARWLGDGSVPAGCRRAWAWPRRSVVGARLPGALDPRARPAPASCPSGRSMLRMSGCGPSLPAAFASPATGGSSAASTRRPPRFPALARAALACVLALAALATPALAQTTVPSDWSLTPTGLTAGAQFRLLFLSSTKRNGSVTTIATYNTFIQNLAAAGHTDIQAYSTGFRVVGCTAAVDARDNTSTTGTGVPIYWLDGNKVADNYADFYDGSWDDEANDTNESGTNGPDTSQEANYPITGCKHDGTESFSSKQPDRWRSARPIGSVIGRPNSSTTGDGPISNTNSASRVTHRHPPHVRALGGLPGGRGHHPAHADLRRNCRCRNPDRSRVLRACAAVQFAPCLRDHGHCRRHRRYGHQRRDHCERSERKPDRCLPSHPPGPGRRRHLHRPHDRRRRQRLPGHCRQRRRHLHHRHEPRPLRQQRLHRGRHRPRRPDRPHGHGEREYPDQPVLDAPADNGGRVITGYKIESSSDGTLQLDRPSSPTLVTGLAGATTSHYRVSAINTIGTGLNVDSATTANNAPTVATDSGPVSDGGTRRSAMRSRRTRSATRTATR